MSLAYLLENHRTALYCDLAETYHIFDCKGLSAYRLAALACGLRPDSRVQMAVSGMASMSDQLMMALAVDRLTWMCWSQTKDGEKGRNRPKQVVDEMMRPAKEREKQKRMKDITKFESGADFEARLARIKQQSQRQKAGE